MIIMPGVPLINGVQDMIRNHMTLGISRLGFAFLVTTAIAFGLLVATVVTGVTIPVDEPPLAIGIPQDAIFSALAALGYAFLFNVPARVAWACVLCGVASHTTRTLCVHLGIDIISGTLIGALAAGFLAQGYARYFEAPAAAFAFPGVVAMVPGAYAFRAVLGSLQIAHGAPALPLVTETLSLGIAVVLMVVAIAVGIAAPALLFVPPHARRTTTFPRPGLSRRNPPRRGDCRHAIEVAPGKEPLSRLFFEKAEDCTRFRSRCLKSERSCNAGSPRARSAAGLAKADRRPDRRRAGSSRPETS
jgi:uncharacterized membrane protein YjjB (DUF3815 family)